MCGGYNLAFCNGVFVIFYKFALLMSKGELRVVFG